MGSCLLISSYISFNVSYPTETIFSCINGSNSDSGICFGTNNIHEKTLSILIG